MRRVLVVLVGVLAVAAAVVAGSAAGRADRGEAHWVIRDLGSVPGTRNSPPVFISARGQIVGERDLSGRDYRHAFLWQNGRMTDLGTLGGDSSSAEAINERGQVIGTSDTAEKDAYHLPVSHGFVWERGKMRDLGTLGGVAHANSHVADINERGQVVGTSATKSVPTHESDRAFLWENGKMVNLGTLNGTASGAGAINERGQVVGSTDGPAFLWQNGRIRSIGAGIPEAINDRGQVLLTRWVRGGGDLDTRAVIWQNGRRRDIGTLGGEHTGAVAMNERGQIIGWSLTRASKHAFLWTDGRMIDIGLAGGPSSSSFSEAIALNDRGQVVLDVANWKPNPCRTVSSCFAVWENGTVTTLPDLPKARNRTTPTLITNTGRIYGWATPPNGEPHAVLWTKTR